LKLGEGWVASLTSFIVGTLRTIGRTLATLTIFEVLIPNAVAISILHRPVSFTLSALTVIVSAYTTSIAAITLVAVVVAIPLVLKLWACTFTLI
jgi:putative Mn2+ efflux pump MntP